MFAARPADGSHVGLHQLLHHLQSSPDREREQALAHVGGDLGHRHTHLLRHGQHVRIQRGRLILLGHSGPLSLGSSWRNTRDLPLGRHQAGDRHLKLPRDPGQPRPPRSARIQPKTPRNSGVCAVSYYWVLRSLGRPQRPRPAQGLCKGGGWHRTGDPRSHLERDTPIRRGPAARAQIGHRQPYSTGYRRCQPDSAGPRMSRRTTWSETISPWCGRCWVRTNVGDAGRFTVCSLWPLGQPATLPGRPGSEWKQ